jgi:colanic acid biosynthesis glycosyl transferase WcaI
VAALLRENGCGLAAPPDDAAAVAEAVRTLKSSAALRRALGASARDYVVGRFAKEAILRSYDDLLRSMVS